MIPLCTSNGRCNWCRTFHHNCGNHRKVQAVVACQAGPEILHRLFLFNSGLPINFGDFVDPINPEPQLVSLRGDQCGHSETVRARRKRERHRERLAYDATALATASLTAGDSADEEMYASAGNDENCGNRVLCPCSRHNSTWQAIFTLISVCKM